VRYVSSFKPHCVVDGGPVGVGLGPQTVGLTAS
jgi:hypothetical protein